MADTSIEWTSGPNGEPGFTFNAWLGCHKVHAGCTNCYAEVHQAVKMRKGGEVKWGEVWAGGQRVVTSESYWKKPFTWARDAANAGQRRKVFCSSLADVLEVPEDPKSWPRGWTDQQIADASLRVVQTRDAMNAARKRLCSIIEETAWMCGGCGRPCSHSSDTPHRVARIIELQSVGAACKGQMGGCLNSKMGGLDFLILTKRPQNWGLLPVWVRPLVWLGTSVADQETADELVPNLLSAQGFRYRFVSAEPLVGPVELDLPRCESHDRAHVGDGHPDLGEYCTECAADGWSGELSYGHWLDPFPDQGINWVIVGGESGPRARPFDVAWARSIVAQCQEAGVACFVKQLGAFPVSERTLRSTRTGNTTQPTPLDLNDPKGGDTSEWPEGLAVRQWPDAMGKGPP